MPVCPLPRFLRVLVCAWTLGVGSAGATVEAHPAPDWQMPKLQNIILCAGLSPEQREQMRSQIREYREQMSSEEREQRRGKMRERRESLSPEERQLLRERIREHRRQHEQQHQENR